MDKGVIELLGGGFLGYFVMFLIALHVGAFLFWIAKVLIGESTAAAEERKNR